MKKFSKLLAVILTVCLLGGMVAVLSSAAPATIDPENQLVIPSNGSGADLVSGNYAYNDYEAEGATRDWRGAHGLPDFTYAGTSAIVTDRDGNSYYSIRRDNTKTGNNNGTSGYLEWKIGGWDNNATSYKKNDMVGHYDYNVFDLDFKTDAYSVWVGYKLVRYAESGKTPYYKIEKAYRTYDEVDAPSVQADIDAVYTKLLSDIEKNKDSLGALSTAEYTAAKISLEDALATKTLALAPGANFYAGIRAYPEAAYANVKGVYGFLYTNEIDGKWYLTDGKNNPYVEIKYDEFIHITYVIKLGFNSSNNKYSATMYVFANGEFLFQSSGSGYAIICADSFRIQAPVAYKDKDIYSYCFDNLTSNYYPTGYSSGDVYGLDDYFSGTDYKTKPLYELPDVVFNADYASPNGYISVDGVKASLTVDNMFANLSSVVDGSVIETTVDILDYDIPDGVEELTVYCPYGNDFTISQAYVNDYFVIFDGVDTYTVRKASEDEKLTLNWVYIDPITEEQTILKTEKILSGSVPDENDPAFIRSKFNFENASLIYEGYLDWRFDVDGDSEDVDLFDMEPIRALTYYEAKLVMEEKGGVLNIYSNAIGVKEVVEFDYFIGSFDGEDFNLKLDETGTYSNYTDIKKLNEEIARCDNGDTVILKENSVVDFGFNYYALIPAGKSVSIDLNGSVISRSADSTENYIDGMFRPGEGSTLNIYSSKPGAHYVEAVLTKPSSNRVFGTGGIVSVPSTVDGCEINIDGENIAFTGGTIFKFSGGWASTGEIPASNTNKKVLNINGGSYYSILRSNYALFAIQCPDVEINLKDAEFYVNDATYAILHDYADDSANSKYYSSTHTLNANNCEFVAVSSAGDIAKLYYTMGKNSEANFENSTIIGLLAKSAGDLKGSIVLGADNKISTSAAFLNNSHVSAADGYLIANTGTDPELLDVTVKHANVPNRTQIVISDGADGYIYDETTGIFDIVGGKYNLNLDKYLPQNIISSRFDTFGVTILSYEEGTVPPGSVPITWYNSDGTVLATTYGYPGSTITPYPIENVAAEETESKWYNLGYSYWVNATDGAASADSFVLINGENKFEPGGVSLVADIDALINMTYWSHFGVNLFLPIEDGITFVYKGGSKDTGFFNASAPTVKLPSNVGTNNGIYYKGERILTHYVTYLPTIQDYECDEKLVKFIVNEYDINGDGSIGEDEKNIPLQQTFSLNDMEYAIKAATILDCGSDEMHLISSFVRYKRGAYSEMVNGNIPAEAQAYFDRFDAALAAHGENCTCYTDYSKVSDLFTDDEKAITSDSYSDLTYDAANGTGVAGISFTMNLEKPSFSVYVAQKQGVKYTVTAKYKSLVTSKTVTPSKGTTTDVDLGGILCTRYEFRSIPAEDINAIISITVKITENGNSVTYTGDYCLAEYIDNNPDYDMAKIYYDYSYQCLAYYNKIKAIEETLGQGAFNDKQYGVVIREDGTK